MKIVSVSDIHLNSKIIHKLKYVKSDMLIVAGDLTNIGTKKELGYILDNINHLEIKHKIIVLGNHDSSNVYNIHNYNTYEWCRENYPNIAFLDNEIIEIEGLKIYGTPYNQGYKGMWSYEYNEDNIKDLTLPREDVDIIISHEPPTDNNLSFVFYDLDIGNLEFRKYLENTERSILVISGHCHQCGGNYAKIGNSHCYNVAEKILELEV